MTPDIINKINIELGRGINSEPQVVYLLVQIRKILEAKDTLDFENLKFYCDWALHSKLNRNNFSQIIIQHFNEANIKLKEAVEVENRAKIDNIIKMNCFRAEMNSFLKDNNLKPIDENHQSNWSKFLYFYGRVVEDCPLEIRANNSQGTVEKVVLRVERAESDSIEQIYFKFIWTIYDRNGRTGEMFVINSF